MEKTKELYRDAVESWGVESQINMAIEECAEFILAVNKLRRAGKFQDESERAEDLRGEIADCMIMMEQMAEIFGVEQVDAIKNKKLKRLEDRLFRYQEHKL